MFFKKNENEKDIRRQLNHVIVCRLELEAEYYGIPIKEIGGYIDARKQEILSPFYKSSVEKLLKLLEYQERLFNLAAEKRHVKRKSFTSADPDDVLVVPQFLFFQ